MPVPESAHLWVKICGLTTPEGVASAVAAQADAIGFVFAPSKRRVTPERATELARGAPDHVVRVAVMLHPTQAELDAVWSGFGPDVLQTDVEDLARLDIPAGLVVMPVLRSAVELPAPRVLFEGAVSGAGKVADWNVAATMAKRTQLILAGGLDATNVDAAVRAVAPFGVDVSSGVERAPGIKDERKIHEFIQAARAAWGA
ncbi:MAG: phosphoribosylanthranilate isomerase [Steroidobacteraceae bacterium]